MRYFIFFIFTIFFLPISAMENEWQLPLNTMAELPNNRSLPESSCVLDFIDFKKLSETPLEPMQFLPFDEIHIELPKIDLASIGTLKEEEETKSSGNESSCDEENNNLHDTAMVMYDGQAEPIEAFERKICFRCTNNTIIWAVTGVSQKYKDHYRKYHPEIKKIPYSETLNAHDKYTYRLYAPCPYLNCTHAYQKERGPLQFIIRIGRSMKEHLQKEHLLDDDAEINTLLSQIKINHTRNQDSNAFAEQSRKRKRADD